MQVFNDIPDRDANAGKMIEGDLCYVVTVRALYVRRPAAQAGFGTLVSDWINYTPAVIIGGTAAGALTVNYSKYRITGARRVEYVTQFIATNLANTVGGLQFTLPLPSTADSAAAGIAAGSGAVSPFGAPYIFGQVRLSNNNYAAVRDPATGAIWQPPVSGVTRDISVYAELAYEVPDQ